jgi:hypothetical protein
MIFLHSLTHKLLRSSTLNTYIDDVKVHSTGTQNGQMEISVEVNFKINKCKHLPLFGRDADAYVYEGTTVGVHVKWLIQNASLKGISNIIGFTKNDEFIGSQTFKFKIPANIEGQLVLDLEFVILKACTPTAMPAYMPNKAGKKLSNLESIKESVISRIRKKKLRKTAIPNFPIEEFKDADAALWEVTGTLFNDDTYANIYHHDFQDVFKLRINQAHPAYHDLLDANQKISISSSLFKDVLSSTFSMLIFEKLNADLEKDEIDDHNSKSINTFIDRLISLSEDSAKKRKYLIKHISPQDNFPTVSSKVRLIVDDLF